MVAGTSLCYRNVNSPKRLPIMNNPGSVNHYTPVNTSFAHVEGSSETFIILEFHAPANLTEEKFAFVHIDEKSAKELHDALSVYLNR